MSAQGKAKRIQEAPPKVQPPVQARSKELSPPTITGELRESLSRSLRVHKAETIATEVDRKRSTIYAWAAHPDQVPLVVLPALSEFDPDPEFLPRVASLLMTYSANRALRRRQNGEAVVMFTYSAPVQADPESVRRATGQHREGDD